MAKVSSNLVTTGLKGMVGGTLVFRKLNGQTIVSSAPEKGLREPSEKQRVQQDKFRLASLYASRVYADPVLLEEYSVAAKKKGYANARALIVADYFRLPEILNLVVNTKPAGSVLEILVVDFMRAKSVTVSVLAPDGSVSESGKSNIGIDKQTWTYRVENVAHLVAGTCFEVKATDLPGNVTTKNFDYQV